MSESNSKYLVNGKKDDVAELKTEINPFEKSFGLQFDPSLSASASASVAATAAAATATTVTANVNNQQAPPFTPGISSLLKSFGDSDNISLSPFLNSSYSSQQQHQPPQPQTSQALPPPVQTQAYPPQNTSPPRESNLRQKRSQSDVLSDDSDEFVYTDKHPRRKSSSGSAHNLSNHKPWREIDLGNNSPQLIKPVGRAGNPSLYISEDGKELSYEERKQLMLNRNREAASRCRQRKKLWINQVQDQADNYQRENADLKEEVLRYRNMVIELRENCAELKLSLAQCNDNKAAS